MENFDHTNITTATTTVVKAGSGYLKNITINNTVASTITIYDSTAGSGTLIGTLEASVTPRTLHYDLHFATGLTIVTAGASDLTVVYQ